MPNAYLLERLKSAQQTLLALHSGGAMMSSSTKGREREHFTHKFLAQVLPPIHRFGTGDIIDSLGQRSGQVDIVIEHPMLPSLPLVAGEERLYLAESVAAVIEIKSDVSAQWVEVERTARGVKKLRRPPRRDLNPSLPYGQGYPDPIPVFAVGYRGWVNLETLGKKLGHGDLVNGILVIDRGLFAAERVLPYHRPGFNVARGFWMMNNVEGPMALWGLICTLQQVMHGLTNNGEWIRDYIQ